MNFSVSNDIRGIIKRKGGVHQLLPGFATGDAISNFALKLQNVLRSQGCESNIYTLPQNVSIDGRPYCNDYISLKSSSPNDIVIFHFGVGSELTSFFKKLQTKKVLIYHNITPPKYFEGINREKKETLERGIDELKSLRNCADLALGVSEYNRLELEKFGFGKTGVLNLILNEEALRGEFNKEIINRYNDNYVNFISVGRLTPNKKPEDIIKIFYYYKKCINPNCRLFLVGSITGMSNYVEYLRGLTAILSLPDVIFTGHVDDKDLRTYYSIADLFITMSEHEGFCIPLLESMFFKVPIVAYKSSAVTEILNNSGFMVDEKNYQEIAEMLLLILTDRKMRDEIIENQNKRLRDFDKEKTLKRLKQYLEQI